MARRKVKPTTERTNAQRVKQLREIMEKHGLSGVAVAQLLNVHEMTVSKWRTGTHPMPEGSLKFLELYTAQR